VIKLITIIKEKKR